MKKKRKYFEPFKPDPGWEKRMEEALRKAQWEASVVVPEPLSGGLSPKCCPHCQQRTLIGKIL